MSLVPKFLQLPFQFLEVYLINLKLLSNLWKLMLTNIFRLILLFEFLTLECIAYECRTASKCLKGFGLLNQPTKQEPKFQLIGSQLQQCKKSTELTSNILKNGIIFVSVKDFGSTKWACQRNMQKGLAKDEHRSTTTICRKSHFVKHVDRDIKAK